MKYLGKCHLESKCKAAREGGGLFFCLFFKKMFTNQDKMALGLTELTLTKTPLTNQDEMALGLTELTLTKTQLTNQDEMALGLTELTLT